MISLLFLYTGAITFGLAYTMIPIIFFSWKKPWILSLLATLRITTGGILLYYLLNSPFPHPILILMVFSGTLVLTSYTVW